MPGWRQAGALLVGAVLLLGALVPARLAQYAFAPAAVGALRLDVPAGAGGRHLARRLAEAGPWSWEAGTYWALRLWGDAGALKVGTYAFSGDLRLVDVFADVSAGRVEQVAITFPEGLSGRDMGALLERTGITDAQAFEGLVYDPQAAARWGLPGSTLEGFLFPDTYRFARGLAAQEVVDALVARFRQVAEPWAEAAEARGLDLLEWVTLASMVEKETGVAGERATVAAVFHNRLQRRMRLESDPTVIYGIAEFDGNLRRADLERDTPYNTYTRHGLPAGPIANPGAASLAAVAHPADVPYLYFVSRNDGTHQFSASYREHREAVDRYQRRRKR